MTRQGSAFVAVLAVGLIFPKVVFASPYGQGGFGASGAYGAMSTPTPTPTPASVAQSVISFFSPTPSSCTKQLPGSKPVLFQVDRRSTTATLHFVPSKDPYTGYTIMYGFSETDQRFSVDFTLAHSSGAVTYKVNALNPSTTYYFKVRAINDCKPSDWSESVKTSGVIAGDVQKFYPGLYKTTATAKSYEIIRDIAYQTPQKSPLKEKNQSNKTTAVQKTTSKKAGQTTQSSLVSKIIDFLKFW